MTPGHMTVAILATMMTAEVAAVDATMTIDGTMTVPEIMTEETVIATVTAVVMAGIGMTTGDTRGGQVFIDCRY